MEHRREAVAAEIRAELARQNKSKAALAAQLNISTDTLRRRLEGVRPFYFHEAEIISGFLDIPLSVILKRSRDAA